MKNLCFFHTDLDGHCAGAIVRKFIPDCLMHPINYGQPFPWDDISPDDTVYMVDFSLQPWINMELLNENCKLIWIDHHKGVICDYVESNVGIIEGIQEVGIGACALAWEYFNGQCAYDRFADVPTAVKLLAQWDVFDHHDPRCNAFQYGMRAMDTDPSDDDSLKLWDLLLDGTAQVQREAIKYIVSRGEPVYKYAMGETREYVKSYAFETDIDGLRSIAVNRTGINSLAFEGVFDPNKHDCMCSFAWIGGKWTVGLYGGDGGPDLSVVAKKHGGGGHPKACGFQTKKLPFKVK